MPLIQFSFEIDLKWLNRLKVPTVFIISAKHSSSWSNFYFAQKGSDNELKWLSFLERERIFSILIFFVQISFEGRSLF